MTAGRRSSWLIVTGLTVAGLSIVALAGVGRTTERTPPAAVATTVAGTAQVPAPTSVTTVQKAVDLDGASGPTVVHLQTPPPHIDGLTDAVSRVLAARGFAETLQNEDPTGELSDAIVAVLADRGVTLSVAEGSTP